MALYYCFSSLFAVATLQFKHFFYHSNDENFLPGDLTAGETFHTDVFK